MGHRCRLGERRGRLVPFSQKPLWQAFRFGEDSSEEIAETVDALWKNVSGFGVETYDLADGMREVKWDVQEHGVDVLYYEKGGESRNLELVRVAMSPGPDLTHIIECLGAPRHYRAVQLPDFANAVGLQLWYVDRGIVVDGFAQGGEEQLTAIPHDLLMDSLCVVPPGDLKEMVATLHKSIPGSYILCVLKPWPGSIKAMEIEDVNPPRCDHLILSGAARDLDVIQLAGRVQGRARSDSASGWNT